MMKAININWDTDEDTAIVLPVSIEIPEDITDEEEISDFLSNITGYCHKGFDLIKEIEPTKKELTRIECIDYICENIDKIKRLINKTNVNIKFDKNDEFTNKSFMVSVQVKKKWDEYTTELKKIEKLDKQYILTQALIEFMNNHPII